MNLKKLNIVSNHNEIVTSLETNKDLSMTELPIVLNDSIQNWTQRLRAKRGRHINGYRELALLVGRSESTIRSFTNEFSPAFPTVDVLMSIVNITKDVAPLEFLCEYYETLAEISEAEK